MKGDLLVRPYATDSSMRSRKRRSGYSTAVSAAIMIAAVSMLGSVMVIWANSNFNAQQRQIGDSYEKNSNLLKETYIIEDVWLSKIPANHVNVTLRNIGDIAVDIKEVKVVALDTNGNPVTGCTSPPCSVTVPAASIPNNGVISTKQTLRIDVANIDWDHANSKSLDISITTERGSIERIVWKVS